MHVRPGRTPRALAFDALAEARLVVADILLIDTAGRFRTKPA